MSSVDRTIQFGSLDNQHDPVEVGVDDLVIAANVDLLNNKSAVRRSGSTVTSLTGTDLHSMWANQEGTLGMILDGTELSQLDTALNASVVGNMPTDAAVEFEQITNVVVAVSPVAIRFINSGSFVTFSIANSLDDEYEFKALVSDWGGGNCVGFYANCLLVGTDTGIKFSDAGNIGQYDTRDFFLPIPFAVKHIAVVDSGIWACGYRNIAFLSGDKMKDLTYDDLIDVGVLSISQARRGEWKGNERVSPNFAILSETGTFILDENGSMTSLSGDKYRPPVSSDHCSVVRDINGAKQFVTSFVYSSDPHLYEHKTMSIETEEG